MANLIIKSSADNLVLQGSDDSPAITVGTDGTTTFAENATLSGSANNLGTTTAGTLSSGVVFPSGHVIKSKYVQAVGDSNTSSTSWNTVHDELVMTFTPVFATSSILLQAQFGVHKAATGYAQYDFYKNASDFTVTYNVTGLDYGLAFINTASHWDTISMQWLDPVTENSTTEKTYKISLRSTDSNLAYVGWGAQAICSIVAWEIAV